MTGEVAAVRAGVRAPAWAARVAARWWVQVLAVAVLARVVSGAIFVVVARGQVADGWTAAHPGYLDYTGVMWDATWYRGIAEHGYPDGLPVGPDGTVRQNAWAFFPLFPMLVRAVMALTSGSWVVVAPVVATVLGLVAMLVVHAVVADALAARPVGDPVRRFAPLLTVALLATSATAPVLQVAYTESLALLLVACALWAIQRERYALAAAAAVALGFTRAVALPLTLVVVVHGVARLRDGRPFPVVRRVEVAALAVLTAASGFAWPFLVGRLTGVSDAYTRTQGAWRARHEVVPLVPWLDIARWLTGSWAPLVLGALAVLAVLGVCAPSVRRLGPVLRAWLVGYVGYLVAVTEPGTSLGRFAILAFPAWAGLAVATARSRHPRVWSALLLLLGVVGQVAWIGVIWRFTPPADWPP